MLLTPVLLFLVMLIIQFGLWYHAEHVVRSAAQEGVRAARVEGGSATAGQTRAGQFLAEAGRTIVRDVTITASRNADSARVAVSGVAIAVVPGFNLPVRATAASPVESFRGDLP